MISKLRTANWISLVAATLALTALAGAAEAQPWRDPWARSRRPALQCSEVEPRVVWIVGDSITAGHGASDPASGGFAQILARRLAPLGFTVRSAGCPGATSWDPLGPPLTPGSCVLGDYASSFFETWPEESPDVLVWSFGTNDATGYFESRPTLPGEFGDNARRAIAAFTPRMTVLMTQPVRPSLDLVEPHRELRLGYEAEIRKLADELPWTRAIHLADVLALEDMDSWYWASCPCQVYGIHPNDAGHARIADEIEAHLLPLPR